MVAVQIRVLPDEAARLVRAFEVASGRGNLADRAMALADGMLAGSTEEPGRSPAEVVIHVSSLDNTMLLCRRHHRYLHEYGFAAAWREDELVFADPRGRELAAAGTCRPIAVTPWDPEISAETSRPGWDGLAIDYDLCVSALG
jgi:hypothetical protein